MIRSEDWAYIAAVSTHPRVWRRIASDGIDPEDYEPLDHPRVHYLTDRPAVHGYFAWKPLTTVAFEGHIAVLEGDAEAFARRACEWMFDHGARKLQVLCPSYNWHAKSLALLVGFKCEGLLTSCVQWRGRLHDMAVLGMSDARRDREHRRGADRR